MPLQQSSLNDVFRFIKVRIPNTSQRNLKLLSTQFSITLQNTQSNGERTAIANQILASIQHEVARSLDDLSYAQVIYDVLQYLLDHQGATLRNIVDSLDDADAMIKNPSFEEDLKILSDTILLSWFATTNIPSQLPLFKKLYIVYHYLILSLSDISALNLLLDDLQSYSILLPFDIPVSSEKKGSGITSVGVADLLVVKQSIKRYEATEIAHIENIMSGETRSREHRQLERIEETLTLEKETILEKEKELETSERFELNKETSKTIKEDQKYGFDLSVSASYGPTVEVSTGFEIDISVSTETSAKAASKYAKDVIERSLDRIKERVREERIRKIIRETEEKNLHSFINSEENPHIVGIYQFLDKIYEAQVFNYGKRQMFDLMIPEPASYLWYLDKVADSNSSRSLPEPPTPFNVSATDILHLEEHRSHANHHTRLAQKYGATGLTPPPERYIMTTAKFQNPALGGSVVTEHGEILTPPVVLEIAIPAGYKPVSGTFYAIALSDNNAHRAIPFSIGNQRGNWTGNVAVSHGSLGINDGLVGISFEDSSAISAVLAADSKLIVNAMPYETGNYTISVQVLCEAVPNHILQWQLQTHDVIRNAYLDRLMEYKDEVSKTNAELRQKENKLSPEFGVPPSKRKQLMLTELKKHCIAIFMGHWFEDTSTTLSAEPPRFDFDEAVNKGNRVRFLEQAIEWNQMQYAFYPYFWAHHDSWADRIRKDDPDYEFQQFMQSGAARVLIPVRPKFEEAFNHFLETGEIWNGTGEPPKIDDPLYISIVDELRELSGGALDEPTPVGLPWEVRLPTNLILLRVSDDLPEWQKESEETWNWIPVESE